MKFQVKIAKRQYYCHDINCIYAYKTEYVGIIEKGSKYKVYEITEDYTKILKRYHYRCHIKI